ncbi:MAG TPA: DUF1365 domain-containing protein [Rhizomicrobium sp.]|jgi:hypothetical protein
MRSLLAARVFHARLRPRHNRFHYTATYICISVGELTRKRMGIFSIDATNLFNLRTRDYGDGKSPQAWISGVLQDWNIPEADGDVLLVTIPRVLGYAFNPVNFWLCRDHDGALRAVLAEVNNTFGERHCYLCFHDDRRPIRPDDILTARKIFHVSPFIQTKGVYRFRFAADNERIVIGIDLSDDEGELMKTSLAGPLRPMTSVNLLTALLINPFLPLKIITLIHFQAVRLFLKRLRPVPKPEAPSVLISH